MADFGRILFFAGLVMALVGLLVWKAGFGQLPGDLVVRRGNFGFYFPIVTSILVSLLLTFLLWLVQRR